MLYCNTNLLNFVLTIELMLGIDVINNTAGKTYNFKVKNKKFKWD